MAEAEGKRIAFLGLDMVDRDVLETFPAVRQCDLEAEDKRLSAPMDVLYETHEFSAVCPFSGLPDIAALEIRYTPAEKVVELKSLKYYLLSYRSVGVYQEHVTRLIARDLADVLRTPVTVKTVYNTRGGIDTTCQITVNPV